MRRILALAALAVTLAAVFVFRPRAVDAGAPCTVPKSWGSLRAMAVQPNGLVLYAFEDEAGTVRQTVGGCKPGRAVEEIARTSD